ncbi:MFS transporter [Streptomyces sp. NPDC006551]|uniref:MFS transporter n=1 Tax=Streptomyces sp. NPDC006551 TaxID=3157178 RepID=UPI0033AF2457
MYRRAAVAAGALAGAQFVVTLSTSIVNVALPVVGAGLGLTGSGLSWVVNAYGLAFGALLLLGGRAADLFGAGRVLKFGLRLFAAASFAAGLAQGPETLVAARALQGMAAAAVAPAALALLMELFPPGARRARALGLWGAMTGAGGAAGVLAGGVLTETLGWPWVFHASGLAAAAVLIAVRTVPPPGPGARAMRRRLDVGGALAVTAGLVVLVHGLTVAGDRGWSDPQTLGRLAAAMVLIAVFALIERFHPAPLLPRRIVSRGTLTANVLTALLGAVWLGLFFFLPLYQQRVLGMGPFETGVLQLPLAAANMLGAWLAPRLARTLGPRAALAAGLAVQTAGLVWLSRAPADGGFLHDVLGPIVLIGLGLGIAFVQLTAAAMSGAPAGDTGLAGGLVNTSRQIGGAMGLAVLGSLATAAATAATTVHGQRAEAAALTEGYRTAFLAAAAIAAAATALVPLLPRLPHPPRLPRPQAPAVPAASGPPRGGTTSRTTSQTARTVTTPQGESA